MTILRLPDELREELEGMIQAGYPREACGLLLGHHAGAEIRVARVVRARNVDADRARHRYALDPRDYLEADGEARAAGLELVGVWHSHPDGSPLPSETDRAVAWPGWSYLIVSVTSSGVGALRSWRLNGRHFEEEILQR